MGALFTMMKTKKLKPEDRLMQSCESGDFANVQQLIDDNVDVNCIDTDGSGNTPLHLASSRGYLSICKALFHAKADVQAVNKAGKTPIDVTSDEKTREFLTKASQRNPGSEISKFTAY